MLLNLQNKYVKAIAIVVLLTLFVLVRLFENTLFYDPFLVFFKKDYQNLPLPKFEEIKLIGSLSFRYFLNSILTLLMVFVLFKSKSYLKLSAYLLGFAFLILIIGLSFQLFVVEKPNYLFLFYLRRFLIQPLFLILFIPAFFYQKKS